MKLVRHHKILDFIKPKRMIFKNQLYIIDEIDSKYNIRGYTIKTYDNIINQIILNVKHPNANPNTGELCIPEFLKKHIITKKSLTMIKGILYCFNLDDCYFTPWNEMIYKEIGDFLNG